MKEPPRTASLVLRLAFVALFLGATAYFMLVWSVGSTLYIGQEHLLLQRTDAPESELLNERRWTSRELWGNYQPSEGETRVRFYADGQDSQGQSISTTVLYDFDGDGEPDRREVYEGVTLDLESGWQTFDPPQLHGKGRFQDFKGGYVTLVLESRDGQDRPVLLPSKAGYLVLPYQDLTIQKPPAS